MVEALSTHLGFFCRIDITSNAIVCPTEARGRISSCSEIRHVDQVSHRLLQLRLLTTLKMSYEAAKKRAEPYTKIMEELPQMRRETVHLVRQVVSEGRRAYVLVNNRVEGNAPLTIQVLTDQLRDTPILFGFRWPYLINCH